MTAKVRKCPFCELVGLLSFKQVREHIRRSHPQQFAAIYGQYGQLSRLPNDLVGTTKGPKGRRLTSEADDQEPLDPRSIRWREPPL